MTERHPSPTPDDASATRMPQVADARQPRGAEAVVGRHSGLRLDAEAVTDIDSR